MQVVDRDGNLATNFIDCYRADHFALEGKATGQAVADNNRGDEGERIEVLVPTRSPS